MDEDKKKLLELMILGLEDSRLRKILRCRFGIETGEPMTLDATAEVTFYRDGSGRNVSRERVRQLEYRGIRLIRSRHPNAIIDLFIPLARTEVKKRALLRREEFVRTRTL